VTLTTHALVGASAAVLFPEEPLWAFLVGFASHFAIDSLPHWDYKLRSLQRNQNDLLSTDMKFGKDFLIDLRNTAGDSILGVSLSVLMFAVFVFQAPVFTVLAAACGGILPDFLQFVYFKTRSKLLEPLQKFHIWIQKGKTLMVSGKLGIPLQALLVLLIIAGLKIYRG
jgi:hypothetical protein